LDLKVLLIPRTMTWVSGFQVLLHGSDGADG
jgi:hypothetical protein